MQTKNLFYSVILGVLPFLMNAQDYKLQFQNDICDCMVQKAEENKMGKNPMLLYQLCFQEKLPTYVPNIDAEITATEQREIYAEGQRIREELKFSFYSELIGTCDFYYQEVEATRETNFSTLKKIGENSDYYNLVNQALAMQPTASNYVKRGQVYFGKENFLKAKADLSKALTINENERGAKILLAWTYEKMNKYASAIELLETLDDQKRNQEIQLLIAIQQRKMGGKLPIVKPSTTHSDVPSKAPEKKDDLKKLFKLD